MVLNLRFYFTLILILTLAAGAPTQAENLNCLRLHVIAADNSAPAQALKLTVRDAALQEARRLLSDAHSADAAWRAVNQNRAALEKAAVNAARIGGYGGPVRCLTGVCPFPDRRYGDVTLPAGRYRALRVVIGPGEGRNWWCVLYPSLCYPEGVDPEHPAFYSSVWRWLQSLFGGEGT